MRRWVLVLVSVCLAACHARSAPPPIAAKTSPPPPSAFDRAHAFELAGDYASALRGYRSACPADPRACTSAAFLIVQRKVQSTSPDEAHRFFALACGSNFREPSACAQVGVDLVTGVGGTGDATADRELGAKLLGGACDRRVSMGCYNFGILARDGLGVTRDLRRAFLAFARACDLDAAPLACREEGLALLLGRGVAEDHPRAITYLEKACRGGAVTCFDLARAHAQGLGVPRDEERARGLYRTACDAGEPAACFNLGAMLVQGQGGAKDPSTAREMFQRACKAGISRACT